MGFLESEKAFKLAKIILIFIHSVLLLSLLIYLFYFVVMLVTLPSDNPEVDLETEYHLIITFTTVTIIFEIFGLIGIIYENKCILILFILVSSLVVIINTLKRGFGYGLLGVVITFLTGYYYHMIGKFQQTDPALASTHG